ncbi:hypothetical protein M413DRAFT_158737 [Hebeloma cylindrosporum]|uniref:Uncharacterized protein n=1 Tax=Hebeloma cylindrosporum TaxID=76867 RepID=A0A0C3CA05_HEBCY|nr:hypothetical protein M413DRAFT_158737 [Hebeloma cylindrosporum h7]
MDEDNDGHITTDSNHPGKENWLTPTSPVTLSRCLSPPNEGCGHYFSLLKGLYAGVRSMRTQERVVKWNLAKCVERIFVLFAPPDDPPALHHPSYCASSSSPI